MAHTTEPSQSQIQFTQLLTRRGSGSAAARIARAVSAGGSTTAEELSSRTGLARSTVSTALSELRDLGIIVESEDDPARQRAAGRPVKTLSLNRDAGTTLGVHLALQEIEFAIVDVAHNVLCRQTVTSEQDYAPETASHQVFEAVKMAYAEHGLNFSGLLGVGVSVSGPVSPDGKVLHSSILPRWAGKNVRSIFEPVFKRPVTAKNESNCAALAEMTWGVARGVSDFVILNVDLGVGGAIVQDGEVISGVAGGGGEFGHMAVVPDGELCRCGNRGCLETIASFAAPLEKLTKEHGKPLTIKEAIALAKGGDQLAIELIQQTARNAGWGLSMIGTAINPPLIIIGGQMVLAGDMFMRPLIDAYERHVMIKAEEVPHERRTQITRGLFTQDDSLRGAAGLVLHTIGDVLEFHASFDA